MDDKKIEEVSQTAPRVDGAAVNTLMDRVHYVTTVPEGTTSTFCHGFLQSKDGKRQFFLATGHSACVNPENFDAKKGIEIATSKAQQAVSQELWKLLGFELFRKEDK